MRRNYRLWSGLISAPAGDGGGGFSTFVGEPSKTAAAGKTGGEAGAGEEGKSGKEGAKADDADQKTGGTDGDTPKAPERYELKVPAEARRFVEDDDVKLLEALARENDWTNEEAQVYLNEQIEAMGRKVQKQWDKFKADTEADPDYGGARLAETTELSRRAVSAIRPVGHPRREAFIGLLNETGYGNHPEVVAFMADLGKLLGEDAVTLSAGGRQPADKPKSDSDVMFPTTAAKT